MALAHGATRELHSLVIRPQERGDPIPIVQLGWSALAFQEWKKDYPYDYQNWLPSMSNDFGVDWVRDSLAGLSIDGFPTEHALTIVADADLFGFPFPFLPVANEFVGTERQIAVVPSLPWLVTQRKASFCGNGRRVAWLGHPTRCDEILAHLTTQIRTDLEESGIEISSSHRLPDLRGSAIAIIACHGQVGFLQHFRGLTDGCSTFSPEDLGEKMEQCGIVVLLSCSGGRTDARSYSMEGVGAVASLLDHGVRAVISPLWPIPTVVAEIWIRPFVQCLQQGGTVGVAAAKGARAIRERFDHPCAWAALPVFGDQMHVVT
jgi:hypothetical protein